MKYYLKVFTLYSVIGYLYETILKYLAFPDLNNGFLYGPWIPIYGFGSCIIILIMNFVFRRFNSNRIIKTFLIFVISIIIITILEFLGGHMLNIITKKDFWDYTSYKYHLGKYIALEISIIWGIMAIFVTYVINPWVNKIIKKIPNNVFYLIFSLITIDFIINILNVIL